MNRLQIKGEGDRRIVALRRFEASPEQVYRAHCEEALIQRWLLGPDGWSMPACVNEPWPGGRIRYEWSDGDGHGFCLTGEVLEAVPFCKIVHVERMHLPEVTPDNVVETAFEPDGAGTLMTLTMTLLDEDTQQAMLDSGMEEGMEASYARLDLAVAANR